MKRIKEFLICLAVSWLFVGPVVFATIYTHGWKIGFEQCDKVWSQNIDKLLENIQDAK